jgi:hypothetical protein
MQGSPAQFGVLFYYSQDVGVTAFMFTPSLDEMTTALPSRSWSLIAEKGFLVGDFGLPAAGANKPCSRN